MRGTGNVGARACRTSPRIDPPEPREVIERIAGLAKRGCFAEQMIQAVVPLTSTHRPEGAMRLPDLPRRACCRAWSAVAPA